MVAHPQPHEPRKSVAGFQRSDGKARGARGRAGSVLEGNRGDSPCKHGAAYGANSLRIAGTHRSCMLAPPGCSLTTGAAAFAADKTDVLAARILRRHVGQCKACSFALGPFFGLGGVSWVGGRGVVGWGLSRLAFKARARPVGHAVSLMREQPKASAGYVGGP